MSEHVHEQQPAPKRRRRFSAPRVNFAVTEDRINSSTKRDSGHCMIADALKDAMPDAKCITVDLATIRWSDPEKRLRYTYLTPREAQEALIDFDAGVVPKPFEVKLTRAATIIRGSSWGRTKKPAAAKTAEPPKDTTPKKGREKAIVEPSDDALLGPAYLQHDGTAVPTIIGGYPLRRGLLNGKAEGQTVGGTDHSPGNIARRRQFGLRMLRR